MKIKSFIILILLFLSVGCNVSVSQSSTNNTKQESKKLSEVETLTNGFYTTSSSRQIRITNISNFNFPKSGPALVMYYKTEIPVENKKELRKEVDEIWEVFRKDTEKAEVKSAAIRAVHDEETNGIITNGKGYGFVFIQKDDNSWFCIDDEEKESANKN